MRDEYQRELVKKLRSEMKSFNEIGVIMGLSRHIVRKLYTYKRITHPKRRGKKPILKSKDQLAIKRTISRLSSEGKKVNSSKLKIDCKLEVSTRTVRRHLAKMGMRYMNIKKTIFLTKMHKQKRVEMVKKWLTEGHQWDQTIFSDEKRFTLDGCDNWMTYTQKHSPLLRQKRQCQGGGIMVWLMVMPNGLLTYKFIQGKFRSVDYIDLLQKTVVPIAKLNYGSNFYFQQDNCSIHKSKVVSKFLEDSQINILDWPSRSPDLNIVEDIWKLLSDEVYDGSQFRNAEDLKTAVNRAVYKFNSERRENLKALYQTITRRLCTVLEKRGDMCK